MSTQDPSARYAFWISPDRSWKVVYSLSAFQEIDDIVNEGYRRIPHGGVETGGLLFGTKSGNTLNIEAQRLIQCQHAFGPSFVLSDNDLSGIKQQLASAPADEDLAGLVPLGWFIGHTRNPLQMNTREARWFEEVFGGEGNLTLLVKPERFQPTRFAFLLRDQSGEMLLDSEQGAVILPLSGQGATSSDAPAPSIPAPRAPEPAAPRFSEPPAPRVYEPVVPEAPEPLSSTPFDEPAFAEAPPLPPPIIRPVGSEPTRVRNTPAPPPYVEPARPAAENRPDLPYPYASLAPGRTRTARRQESTFSLQSAAVLVLAAVLGSIAGYWAYLQLPSPVIPVSVREQGTQLVVEWPAAQTEKVDYAALQVNDGQWVTLSPEQKANGRASITVPSGDLKVDLVAKHLLRDSRGIVRYIRTPRTAPQ